MPDLDAATLTRHNLAYRLPALYDELAGDEVADEVIALVDTTGTDVDAVLDLGCGTGRNLARIHERRGWGCTGVDVQAGLLDYARRTHAALGLVQGDIRAVRIENTAFDLIVCLGNTLAYLHAPVDVTAAFTTMAAHARTGTLLALGTITENGRDAHNTSTLTSSTIGAVTVDTSAAWNPQTRTITSSRTWHLADGRTEQDQFVRKIWARDDLVTHAAAAGFEPLPHEGQLLAFRADQSRFAHTRR